MRKIQLSSIFLLLMACQDGGGDEAGTCEPGSLGCECVQGQLCLGDLECNAGICAVQGDAGDGDGEPGDGDGEPGDGDGEPGDGDGEPGDGDGEPGDGDGEPGDGDGEPGDGDGDPNTCDPGSTDCDGNCVDLLSDDSNCGACGVECKITGDIGQCAQGQCGNAWSECHDANTDFVPCSEVCQDESLTCMAQGCSGATYRWYEALDECEVLQQVVGQGSSGCENPQVVNADYYRCCCAQ